MSSETVPASQGLLDVERELTCSICTDILYQPLTLLDCLHSFCGPCLKEWFSFQAAAAATQNRRLASPYTCPSCRESVRGTKADWRVTTLLEGYLKANPDRVKSEEEKEEMKTAYKPGDNVIPKLQLRRRPTDDEDERLIAQVRELSMADVNPATRTNRSARGAQVIRAAANQPHVPGNETGVRHVEHQSSLRSLLSASPISVLDAGDVQQEILQSIYAEGLLDDIDIDNLTTEQEEELTERIAEAYRRRQRRRDRSGNRERPQHENTSPQPDPAAGAGAERRPLRQHARTVSASDQAPRSRARVPIARPHVFEQVTQDTPPTSHRRNTSDLPRSPPSGGHPRSAGTAGSRPQPDAAVPGDESNSFRQRHRRMSSNARSTTDPEHEGLRAQANQPRASSHNPPRRRATDQDGTLLVSGTAANSSTTRLVEATSLLPPVEIRSAPSISAFAPEPISSPETIVPIPAVSCGRCGKHNIQHDLHYHCSICRDGNYDICLTCYRNDQGCDHWFGFGYMAFERWHRLAPPEGWPPNYAQPHVLTPRQYGTPGATPTSADNALKQGAFCEQCFSPCNDCYYYCMSCLEGAWGFCAKCVQQGRHCTHSLMPLGDMAMLQQPDAQTSKPASFILPHLPNRPFVGLPVLTDCDICRRAIPPQNSRFHCCTCSDGDYDVCTQCYDMLVATERIRQPDGPNGWRRCLQGHRMTVVAYQDISRRGRQRVTIRDPIGGWQLQETPEQRGLPPPSDGSLGSRCLAIYNWFASADDELSFPKNAEIREVQDINVDWCRGTYAGGKGLFPSNHVRKL